MALSASTAHAACISEANPLNSNREYFSSVGRITAEGYATGADDVVVAEDFSVHYDTYFKVVKTLCGRHALAGCTPTTYVLRMCGASAPTAFSNGTALPSDAKHFSVPLTDVGVGQSTPVTYLEMLGLRDAIKIIDPEHVHSPCLQKLEEEGSIAAANDPYGGDNQWAAAIATMPSIDAVFTDSWGTAGTGTDKDIVFDASNDPGALARAEWIKFVALFFNEEERANLYFDREKAAFESTSALAAAAAGSATKKCAWVSKGWSGYVLDFKTYKTDFCRGAGMTPVTDAALVSAGTYTKTFADKAAFVAALADYDVVIDETYIASPANANADKAAVLAALDVAESDFKTGAVLLRVDRHLGDVVSTTDHATHTMDWYESALPRPALVLLDLAHMVWPDAFPAPEAGCARYFRGIFSDTITKPIVNGKAQCDVWSAAESEAKCLTNAVLDTDSGLSVNTPPPSPPPPPVVVEDLSDAAPAGAKRLAVAAVATAAAMLLA